LSAKVLRLVNSAFYSLRSPISSIRHASTLLGVRTLKSLALSVSVINIFKKNLPGFDPARFWRHALAVALVAEKAAQRLGFAFPDEVYICGLLHDTGVALLIQHYPEEFSQVASPECEGTPVELLREEEVFGQAHPEVGFSMANHWRLPALIGTGIRYHHTPPEGLPPKLEPEGRQLITVVQFADAYARRSGHSFAEMDRLDPNAPLPELKLPGLDGAGLAALMGDLDHSIVELGKLFLDPGGEEKAS
jgi:two-component system cell cycle response regulator